MTLEARYSRPKSIQVVSTIARLRTTETSTRSTIVLKAARVAASQIIVRLAKWDSS